MTAKLRKWWHNFHFHCWHTDRIAYSGIDKLHMHFFDKCCKCGKNR